MSFALAESVLSENPPTRHPGLLSWVREIAELVQRAQWAPGIGHSSDEHATPTQRRLDRGQDPEHFRSGQVLQQVYDNLSRQ